MQQHSTAPTQLCPTSLDSPVYFPSLSALQPFQYGLSGRGDVGLPVSGRGRAQRIGIDCTDCGEITADH